MTRALSVRTFLLPMLACAMFPWGAAQAHGVWVAQRTGEWAVVLGESSVDDAYKPEAVKSVAAQSGDGKSISITVRPQEQNAVLLPAPGAAAVGVSFVDGFWSEDAAGKWHAGSRLQVPQASKAGYYQMFSRTVLAASSQPGKPFGLPLEIVPQEDPMSLKMGASLRVQVLFDGKPLSGATVVRDYLNDNADRSVKTDEQGYAAFQLRSAGLNVIKVTHNVPRKDRREADEDGFASTLAFSLPHKD
jgi:uncharacterized GH25 family protein